jgi:hypothetical protein
MALTRRQRRALAAAARKKKRVVKPSSKARTRKHLSTAAAKRAASRERARTKKSKKPLKRPSKKLPKRPGKPSKPTKSIRSSRPGKPSKPTKPTRPGKPGKPARPITKASRLPPRPPAGPPPPRLPIPKDVERKLTADQLRAIATLPEAAKRGAIQALIEEHGKKRRPKPAALAEKERAKEEKKAAAEKKKIEIAVKQLKKAVKQAAKDGGKLYGEYNERTHERQKVKGTFAGFKLIPFAERADYIQEELKKRHKEWRRDLYVQSVHVREYMTQGDGGSGRRAIMEKVQNAGRNCIDERIKGRKVYQIYIGMIRVLVRQEDAGKYGGYSTRPIDGKRIKAATDVRGLEGFENVMPGEDPKTALDRLLERLENHLDDILDGLPVVYIKSIQVKFDVEAK